jgi:methionyl-tRNA formyltransferase
MGIRVVFWGNSQSVFSSRHFSVLQDSSCNLAAVVDVPAAKQDSTNPLPDGLPNFIDVARQKKIPVFAPDNPNMPAFVNEMQSLTPDLFIAVGYALILKPALLAVPSQLAANFHASLLPHYRGKHPVFWTLRNGERWAGLTVHHMDPGIDTGDIIYQVKVRTRRDDTVSSLYGRIMDLSTGLVGRLTADVEAGTVPRLAQLSGEGSYFSSIGDENFRIDWSWNAARIQRTITITPGKCFAMAGGQRLAFSRAEVARDGRTGTPGTLLAIGRTRCLIAAGDGTVDDGAVWIGRARREGGAEQSMAAACNQLGLTAGEVLG